MWWHEECATQKTDRVVVKLRAKNGAFLKSVIVPSVMYPLNGACEVFTYRNTKRVDDEAVLACFDSVRYKIGRCYDNAERLAQALKEAGFDAVPYVGWAFVADGETPVHHCWVVLNGEAVLDLGDDYTAMLSDENAKYFEVVQSIEEKRELIASFQLAARKVKNRQRCYPVGTPTPFLYYVGSPCDPEEGRRIYCRLMQSFPGHECERNCDANGMNATQRILAQRGLME